MSTPPDDQPRHAVPSWQPGHFVWPGGRTKIILLGGISSRSGDLDRSFGGLIQFLAQRGGYDPRRDFLEATYAGLERDGQWQPTVYTPADTRKPLIDMAEAVAGSLEWYRQRLPEETRLAFVGYSMGGVSGIDGATLAIARDRALWRGRLGAVIALAAPVRGSSVGDLVNWAWLVTPDADGLGAAGSDLDARWRDPEEQIRLERRAAFLRGEGVTVLTLIDPDDSVVRPEEGLLPGPDEATTDLEIRTTVRRPGSLGHGAILDEPATWQRILRIVGPQEGPGQPAVDPIDDELASLKARLRSEGRLK